MVSIAGEFPACKAVINDPKMIFEFFFFFLLFDIDAGVELYLKFIRFLLKNAIIRSHEIFLDIRVTKCLDKVLCTLVKPLTTFPYMRRALGLDLSSMGCYGTTAPGVPISLLVRPRLSACLPSSPLPSTRLTLFRPRAEGAVCAGRGER